MRIPFSEGERVSVPECLCLDSMPEAEKQTNENEHVL